MGCCDSGDEGTAGEAVDQSAEAEAAPGLGSGPLNLDGYQAGIGGKRGGTIGGKGVERHLLCFKGLTKTSSEAARKGQGQNSIRQS